MILSVLIYFLESFILNRILSVFLVFDVWVGVLTIYEQRTRKGAKLEAIWRSYRHHLDLAISRVERSIFLIT
jgi:hypothetical protein